MPDLSIVFAPAVTAAQAIVDGYARDQQAALATEAERRSQAEKRAASLQSQLDDLRANPPVGDAILWKTGTVIESGKTYRLPDAPTPGGIVVDRPNVTLIGGWLVPTVAAPAITVRTAPFCRIIGVKFDVDGAPEKGGKLNVKPAIRTTSRFTLVQGCTAHRIDAFVEAMTGCSSLTVSLNHGTESLRAGFLYAAGASGVAFVGNDAAESLTENLVRASPDGTNVTEDFLIAYNDLANDANGDPEKAVIDVRHVRKARIIGNTLRSVGNHSCVGIGSHDGVGPGADDVLVYDNDCYQGSITVNGGARNVNVEANRAHWATAPGNAFITANFKLPLDGVRVANNSGVSPVAQKPMVSWMGDPAGRKFENVNNLWTVAATQPTQ